MVDFLQLTIAGVAQGAAYGLVAVGFVTIFAVSGIINLAQGEFAMLGAFTAIATWSAGVPLVPAVLVGIAAIAVLAGVIERVTIAPAAGSSILAFIILTVGIGIALRAFALVVWGPDSHALPRFTPGVWSVGGVIIRPHDLWVLAGTLLTAAVLWVFFERTRTGKAFRACSEQPTAARLVGISPARMSRLSFVIAGTVGAVAGILISPVDFTNWNSGLLLGLKGFVAAALAGMVSIPGAIFGGLLLGVVESLSAGYVSSGLKDAVAFLVLVVLLVLRPGGLFGRPLQARV